VTRRELLASAAALPALTQVVDAADSTGDLAALSTRAYAALMKGDAATYAAIMKHTRDFTLMQPFGGAVVHGFDMAPEHPESLGGFFRKGDFRQDIIQSISSSDVAVLVTLEHQSVEVGGLARQDWPLRVTLVFRREEGEWRLAHRHADPLVHGISVALAAALARGDDLDASDG
jgi:ketosteroid isomerase-like protein